MILLRRAASVVRWVLRRGTLERQLDEELRVFVDMAAAEKMASGVPPAEARRLAMLQIGGVEQVKERVRSARHGARLDQIGSDLRYAGRLFVKSPAFTATVLLTLSLGIGLNTAIFSIMEALLWRALPVHEPERLVQITVQETADADVEVSFSHALVRAIAAERAIFAGVAGFSGTTFEVGAAGSTERVRGALVNGGYYDTLGLSPVRGRLLGSADDEAGAPLVAVISHGYWERRFGRRDDVVGRPLLIANLPVTIVGVSPRGFGGANVGAVAEITMPIASIAWVNPEAASLLSPGNFWLRILARPQPGLSRSEAQARFAAAWPRLAEQSVPARWPASRRASMIAARGLLIPGAAGWTYLREIYSGPLIVLMAVAGLVLLIACANVASLMLARSTARHREMAVRLAIGAGRGRIVQQLLIESLLLSAAGGVIGIGIAWVSSGFLVRLVSTARSQIVFDLTPNLAVLGFTVAAAIASGVLFGLAPAVVATSSSPAATFRYGMDAAQGRTRLLPALVVVQVALSLVLLAGAALFVRTLQNLHRFDPGFSATGVLLVDLTARRTAVPESLVDELRAIPGVASASLSTHTPLSGSRWSEAAVPAGQPLPETDTALFVAAGPQFFTTLRIPLLAGREFSADDVAGAPHVAIVNERYVTRFLANVDPLGQHLTASVRNRVVDLTIVGVARNTSITGLRDAPPAIVYVAYAQLTSDFPTTLEVRFAHSNTAVVSRVREILRARLPQAPVELRTFTEQVDATMVQERMLATLAGAFAALAMLLAAIGLYGLLAYRVTQRRKEIGIRMAIGARRTQVVALVLRGAAGLVLAGILIGIPATWAASRWIASMLFGLSPTDPLALGSAIVVLLAVAQFAASVPAWRASRFDPLPALRHE